MQTKILAWPWGYSSLLHKVHGNNSEEEGLKKKKRNTKRSCCWHCFITLLGSNADYYLEITVNKESLLAFKCS